MVPTSTVSQHNTLTRWKQVIWSCRAERGPLLIRYFLIRTRWFGVYLHHFLASDEDLALHDHPWSYAAFLFHRGYWEWREYGPPEFCLSRRVWCPRFSILRRHATWKHRVELPDGQPVWTLVVRGPIVRKWGFWLPNGWLSWQDYGKEYCD